MFIYFTEWNYAYSSNFSCCISFNIICISFDFVSTFTLLVVIELELIDYIGWWSYNVEVYLLMKEDIILTYNYKEKSKLIKINLFQ